MSKDERLDIDEMYLSVIDEELGYAVIPDMYKNWDLFEDDDCDERTIYQIEGPHYTIAHDIHSKAIAETICKVPQMMWELKKCYEREDKLIHALRCAHADLQGLMQNHYTNDGGGRSLHPAFKTLEEIDQLSNEIEELKP